MTCTELDNSVDSRIVKQLSEWFEVETELLSLLNFKHLELCSRGVHRITSTAMNNHIAS